ncbi:MAG: hypothetical protein WAM87_18570, partial [Terriglobales bacterium]
ECIPCVGDKDKWGDDILGRPSELTWGGRIQQSLLASTISRRIAFVIGGTTEGLLSIAVRAWLIVPKEIATMQSCQDA